MEIGINDDSVLYEDVSFQDMKVTELRAACKARNLSTSGLRNDLIARLQAATATPKGSADGDEDSDGGSDMPSRVSIFSDSQLSEELHEDEILNDPDSPTKLDQSPFNSVKTSSYDAKVLAADTKPSSLPVKTLKPLKRTTTLIPSNGSVTSEKKICIDRARIHEPVSEPVVDSVPKKTTHTPITLDTTDKKPSASVKQMTPQEKLALRAKRFNLSSTNSVSSTKTNVLTKGFTSSTTKSNITPITFNAVPDVDKLKKRAERFGGVVSNLLKKIEEKDKVKQRQERFGKTGTISLKSSKSDNILKKLQLP